MCSDHQLNIRHGPGLLGHCAMITDIPPLGVGQAHLQSLALPYLVESLS